MLIIGYARSDLTIDKIKSNCAKYTKLDANNLEEVKNFDEFWKHNVYLKGSYDKGEDFDRLDALIATAETESSSRSGTPVGNRSTPVTGSRTGTPIDTDKILSSASTVGVGVDGMKHGNRLFYLALPPTAFQTVSSKCWLLYIDLDLLCTCCRDAN